MTYKLFGNYIYKQKVSENISEHKQKVSENINMSDKIGHTVDTARKDILDINSIYITGPENVVRLEGKIDGISKVLYLFFDVHFEANRQNECSNIGEIDFAQFFVKTFKEMPKTDVMYDFFMEAYPTRIDRLRIRKFDGIYVQPKNDESFCV
jgi:hypothetical protein